MFGLGGALTCNWGFTFYIGILLDSFKSVQSPGKWKVLVVEESALGILNSVCELHDLSDVSIPVTETLTAVKRTPYPEKDAIYLITPTQECVAALIQDFSGSKTMYAGAHIFCIAALPDPLFDQIKRSPARRRIHTLKEINVDFTPFESQVFHLNDPDAFRNLHDAYDFAKAEQQMNKTAEQMKSVFWTLGDRPTIRYFDAAGDGTSLAAHMAFKLEDAFAEIKEIDPEWPPENSYPQSQIIVLDRTVDNVTPILHSLTYQAAVHDLLQVEGTKVAYTKTNANDVRDKHTAVVDELDPVYRDIRHLFVADAWQLILEMKTKLDSDGSEMDSSDDALKKIEALKAKLFALPEAQKMLEKIVVHIHLYGDIMQAVADRQLDVIAGLQQTIATGEAPNSEKVPDTIYNDLLTIMEDPNVMPLDKLRLILVYAAGMDNADPHRLAEAAQLGLEADAVMGLEFVTNKRISRELRERMARYTDAGRKRDLRLRKKTKTVETADEQVPYDIHRFAPAVKYILQDAVAGKLDPVIFPSTSQRLDGAGIGSSAKADSTAPTIGRGHLVPFHGDFQPTWARKKPPTGNDNQANVDLRTNGSRILVLFVDGLSFAEIRAANEVMRERRREIFIGSTHIMTPSTFVEDLLQLGALSAGPLPIPPVQHKLLQQQDSQHPNSKEVEDAAASYQPYIRPTEFAVPAGRVAPTQRFEPAVPRVDAAASYQPYIRPTESHVPTGRAEPAQRHEPAVPSASQHKQQGPQNQPYKEVAEVAANSKVTVSEHTHSTEQNVPAGRSIFKHHRPDSASRVSPDLSAAPPAQIRDPPSRTPSQSSLSGPRPMPAYNDNHRARTPDNPSLVGASRLPSRAQQAPTPDSSSENLSYPGAKADASQHAVKPPAPMRTESAEPLADVSSDVPLRRPQRVESNRGSRSSLPKVEIPTGPANPPPQASPSPTPMPMTSAIVPPRTKSRGQPVVATAPSSAAAAAATNPNNVNAGRPMPEAQDQTRKRPEDSNSSAALAAPAGNAYAGQPGASGLQRSHRMSYSGPPVSQAPADGRASHTNSQTLPIYPPSAAGPPPTTSNSTSNYNMAAPPTYSESGAAGGNQYYTDTKSHADFTHGAPPPQQQHQYLYTPAVPASATPAYQPHSTFASQPPPAPPSSRPVYRQAAYRQAPGAPTSSSPSSAMSPPFASPMTSPLSAGSPPYYGQQQHLGYVSAVPPPASRYVQAPMVRRSDGQQQRAPSPYSSSARPDAQRYR
ncbi:Syntaxin-binding protein 2 [Geranomyces michiganensis]|nr:Syntaxin-binding protein 2 [Geranomyces michiganensis]